MKTTLLAGLTSLSFTALSGAATIIIDYNDGNTTNGMHDSEIANGGFSTGTTGAQWKANAAPWVYWNGATNNGITNARTAFFEPTNTGGGGAIYNLGASGNQHTVAEGDQISFAWRLANYGSAADRTWQVGLMYYDGSSANWFETSSDAVTIHTSTDSDPNTQNFATVTYTVQAGDAAIGHTLGFGIKNTSTGSTGKYIEVDNTYLAVTPVPEPSSTALLGLGGLALILRRRR